MFFHQGIVMREISDPVGGEEVFQFETIDAGGVSLFDIIVIVVIVEFIDDADTEGGGIGKAAVIDPGYIEMFGIAEVAFRLEDGVHPDEPFADKIPVSHVVVGCFPQSILLVFVFKGNGPGDMLKEIAVGYGQFDFAAVVLEVIPQGLGVGEVGFFPGRLVGFSGGGRKRIAELHVPD